MRKQEIEGRKGEIVRGVQRLLLELQELEQQVPDDGVEQERKRQGMLDFYIPRGLRDIHRLPLPRL